MKRIALFALLLLPLVACNRYDYKVNFNSDPRILRGVWIGEMVERMPENLVYIPGKNQFYGFLPHTYLDAESSPRGPVFVVVDAATGQEVRRRRVDTDFYRYSAWFDPSGERAYSWSAQPSSFRLRVYSTNTWAMERELVIQTQQYYQNLTLNLRTRRFSLIDKDRLRIWDLDGLAELPSLSAPRGHLSDDLKLSLEVASQQGRNYRYWVENLQSGSSVNLSLPTGKCSGEFYRVDDLQFSPDSRMVVGSLLDGAVAVWDAATGELTRRIDLGDQGCHNFPYILSVNTDATRMILLLRVSSQSRATYRVLFWDVARGVYGEYQTEPSDGTAWSPQGESGVLLSVGKRIDSVGFSMPSELQTRLLLVGESGVVWQRAPRIVPLELNLTATAVDAKKYNFEGSARVEAINGLTIRGVQDAEMDHTLIQARPPMPMTFRATLFNPDGSVNSRLAGESYVGSEVPSDAKKLHAGLARPDASLEAYSIYLSRP